ncbi:MAG: hypothetical protein JO290_02860 [Sphingomonadaceae bacterium]|nr:hypothetical protein [Sphingomonadaceae bacterium]
MSRAPAIEWLALNVGRDIIDEDGDHLPLVKLAAHLVRLDSNELASLLFARLDGMERAAARMTAAEEREEGRMMDRESR